MRWEDERYVRVYTRDTTTWTHLTWEARSVFVLLLRKVDRAGILDVGQYGYEGIARVIDVPVDIVERAVGELVEHGCVNRTANEVVVPNFVAAQEARMSSRMRVRRHRERKRAVERLLHLQGEPTSGNSSECNEALQDVTFGDGDPTADDLGAALAKFAAAYIAEATRNGANNTKRNVTDGNDTLPNVTRGNAVKRGVTPSLAEPSLAKPSTHTSTKYGADAGASAGQEGDSDQLAFLEDEAKPKAKRKKNGKAPPGYHEVVAGYQALNQEFRGEKPKWGDKQGAMVKQLLAGGFTAEQVIEHARRMFERAPQWPCENPDLGTLVAFFDKFGPPIKANKATQTGCYKVTGDEEYSGGEVKL